MAVYKQAGRWRYRVVVGSQRISGTPALSTRAAATAAERAHIARTLAPEPSRQKKSSIAFGDYVTRTFLPRYELGGGTRGVNAPTTWQEKRIHLDRHLLPVLGKTPLADARNGILTDLAATLRRKGLGEKSVKNIFATLKTVLSCAVKWGDLAELPEFPRVVCEDPRWDWYTPAEVARLLEVGGTLIRFAVCTGLREGEQLAVRWDDLDLDAGLLRVVRSAPRGGPEGPTKSKRHRSVPLPAALVAELRAMDRESERVFPGIKPYDMHKALKNAQVLAGLREIRWHDLRHTYASILVSSGKVSLRQVQDLLGHASMRTTERYAHLVPGRSDEITNVLRF